jgi:formylglycine-generating enzyme required for sulfatase activity
MIVSAGVRDALHDPCASWTNRFVYAACLAGVVFALSSCSLPARGSVRQNAKDGLDMVWIPRGAYEQGCSKFDDRCAPDEKPPHQVTISDGFWMDRTEVTVGAYRRFAASTHRPLPPAAIFGDHALNGNWVDVKMPIVNVDWYDSQAYCEWIGGRLPTEAQWEYAARAGTTGSTYGDLSKIAWLGNNSGVQPIDAGALNAFDPSGYLGRLSTNQNTLHEAGLKAPNPGGLYDVLGNAWEWTADWYDERFYQEAQRFDPTGPPNGHERVLRGGSWVDPPAEVRVSVRGKRQPTARSTDTGFRCVW